MADGNDESLREWLQRLLPDKADDKVDRWVELLKEQEYDNRSELRLNRALPQCSPQWRRGIGLEKLLTTLRDQQTLNDFK